MKEKYNLYLLLPVIFVFMTQLQAQHGHGGMSADKPSVHGMLIFGREKIYTSHLPLFHAPHNYQVILEIELDKAAKEEFNKDRQLHPEFTTYTIEPERFILPDKISSKGSFKASLYRGHFERGGTKILDSIHIKIFAVIYFKMFDPAAVKPTAANYLLFGNNKEQFAVHQVSNKPDFEQIIQVKAELGNEMFSTVILSGTNNPAGVSGNTISVTLNGRDSTLILLQQLYLEFDDLKD